MDRLLSFLGGLALTGLGVALGYSLYWLCYMSGVIPK